MYVHTLTENGHSLGNNKLQEDEEGATIFKLGHSFGNKPSLTPRFFDGQMAAAERAEIRTKVRLVVRRLIRRSQPDSDYSMPRGCRDVTAFVRRRHFVSYGPLDRHNRQAECPQMDGTPSRSRHATAPHSGTAPFVVVIHRCI